MEQIAAISEIAPSTFFRYFRAKEDLVLTDEYDPLILEAVRSQPAEYSPIQAVRSALRAVVGGLTDEERTDIRERANSRSPCLNSALGCSISSPRPFVR